VAQCIVIGPFCVCVCVAGGRCPNLTTASTRAVLRLSEHFCYCVGELYSLFTDECDCQISDLKVISLHIIRHFSQLKQLDVVDLL